MKTVKIILSAAIVALTVYSCSSDRDEEMVPETTSSKLDLKPVKIENSNNQETAKESDTVIIGPRKTDTMPGTGLDPEPEPEPNEPGIVHPGDVKPPKP